jgi:hypothetical protein
MRPIVAQVNKWWGIGAYVYGTKRLLSKLMWFGIGGIVLVIAASIAAFAGVPFLAPLAGLLRKIPGWFIGLFKNFKLPKRKS